jgi:acyl CoA:acetate/3-ketoacid CoA transferase alpha subunit
MAMAATVTVVEVETEIVPVGEIEPDCVHVPGIYVNRMVKIPEDGIWD